MPGLGQIYSGVFKKGVLFFVGSYLWMLSWLLIAFLVNPTLVLLGVVGSIFYLVVCAWNAAKLAKDRVEFRPKSYNKWFVYLLIWILAATFNQLEAKFVKANVCQVFHMSTSAMMPTLMAGDFIIVNKIIYKVKSPQRGDVVVFKFPLNKKAYYIKRIIGIPGDRVQIREGKVFINGNPCGYTFVANHFPTGKIYAESIPEGKKKFRKYYILKTGRRGDNTPVFFVPSGKYFVLGDNRNNSYDSRYWGFVDGDSIVGKVEGVILSVKNGEFLWSRLGKVK